MHSLFSPDSKFMQAMNRVSDLFFLNVLFLLTSLPVFTIGAGASALYTVCFRFDTDGEQPVLKSYLRAFRENFRQGTILWLAGLLCCAATAVNAMLFHSMSGILHYCFFLFSVILVLTFLVLSYVFPLISQFRNTTLRTIQNAFYLCIEYLPQSLLITVINLFPVGLLIFNPYLFFRTGVLWISLYFSVAAYLNTQLLKKIFSPFRHQPESV